MIMKKQGNIHDVSDAPKSRRALTASPSSNAKKVDGHSVDGRVLQLQSDYDKVKRDYEQLSVRLVELKRKHDVMLSSVRTLEMLLASFNALILPNDVTLKKPEKGKPYWYIRAMSSIKRFEVVEVVWNDSTSDHYRYAKGNMYLASDVANKSCQALNIMLLKLSY